MGGRGPRVRKQKEQVEEIDQRTSKDILKTNIMIDVRVSGFGYCDGRDSSANSI